ncbi:MAG: hypothetical protein JJD98_02820 [Polaromonas sp.]|nr:hypothetical protein [Polaromonas sp.]
MKMRAPMLVASRTKRGPGEALQLASLPKIERALALFMVVSWRIERLMGLWVAPALSCRLIDFQSRRFEPPAC